MDEFASLAPFSVLSGLSAVICFAKGKAKLAWIGVVGLLPPVGWLLVWFPLWGAVRYAKPESSWARQKYGPLEMEQASRRFAGEPAARRSSTTPPVSRPGPAPGAAAGPASEDGSHRMAIVRFLDAAADAGLITASTRETLFTFLEGHLSPAPPVAEPAHDQVIAAPVSEPDPPETTAPPPTPPAATPPAPPVRVATPPARRPAPRRAEPGPVAAKLSEVWQAVSSDIALHGLMYLGVLLTFVGVIGFLLFAFATVPDSQQPYWELGIASIFFVWAWVLRRSGVVLAARTMELTGGMVLPLVVFATLVDGVSFPPDFEGGALVIAMTVSAALLAVAYSWVSARNSDSTLRFLVGPLLWLGALTLGFALKSDEHLAGDAITRLVSAQPAMAAAALALTLVACRWRPQHRLSRPTVRAALVGLPVAYLLTVSLSAGGRWAHSLPLVLVGVATLISGEILAVWFGRRAWLGVMRPLLLAGVTAPLVPTLGPAWASLVTALAYLALFEVSIRRHLDQRTGLFLSATGVAAGTVMSLADPWSALVVFGTLSAWAHAHRLGTSLNDTLDRGFIGAAALLPIGVGHALPRILEPGVAWLLMALILAAVTVVVRWQRSADPFWWYWLTGAGVGVVLGALWAWSEGGRIDGVVVAAMAVAVVPVGLSPRWPALRTWMGAGVVSAALAMGMETLGYSLEQRAVAWALLGLTLTVGANLWRRAPASHMAAIGHLIGAGALFAVTVGAAGAAVVGAWTLGWVASTGGGITRGDSLAALLTRVTSPTGGPAHRPLPWQQWVAPSVTVASIPPAVITAANLWSEFASNRSWSGMALATIGLWYASMARLARTVRPLPDVLLVGAWASLIIGLAVAAPEPRPMIYAAATVLGAAALLTGDLRRQWFVWFAWIVSVGMVLLLAEQAGVPGESLHLVGAAWGGLLLIGGLAFDDARSGRRRRGEGLRVHWLRHPVLLGSLIVPVGLGPVFVQAPRVYGWWSLGAAGGYLLAAYLIRVGWVTAPAFALITVGVAALSPRPFLEEPWLFVLIAGPMVGWSWLLTRLQSPEAADAGWLRWDLAPLVVAHAIAAFALMIGLIDGSLAPTALTFGLLSVLIGLWKRRRLWLDAGNLMVLAAALDTGPGWLALALAGTAARGVIGAAVTKGWHRASYHLIGVTAAALAWVSFLVWQDLSGQGAAVSSMMLSGALGLVTAGLGRLGWLRRDFLAAWGGLALTGATVTLLMTAVPAGPGIDGPWFAIGLSMLALAFELAASVIGRGLRHVTVVSSGLAWMMLSVGMGWDQVWPASLNAAVFGGLGVVVAEVVRLRPVPAEDRAWDSPLAVARAWAALAVIGVAAAAVQLARMADPGAVGYWVSGGLALLAIGAARAAAPLALAGLRYVTVVSSGLAWMMLSVGMGWDQVRSVSLNAVVFGGLGVVVAEVVRLRPVPAEDGAWDSPLAVARAWAALAVIGVAAAAVQLARMADPGAVGYWVSGGLALLAIGAARAAAPLALTWLRDGSLITALTSLTIFAATSGWPVTSFAVAIVLLAVLAISVTLALWRMRPASAWIRPVLALAVAANLEALVIALARLPDGVLLVPVLASVGVQILAIGISQAQPGLVAIGPPLLGAAFVLALGEGVAGSIQWYTVPIGVVVLCEVDVLRWARRSSLSRARQSDVVVLELAGVGLLGIPALAEMFTRGVAYGLLGFGVAAAILLWAIVSRVRRRVLIAGSVAIATAVLVIFAAAAGGAPTTAFYWIVGVGLGISVMLIAAWAEAYRSRKGRTMTRLDQLMEGWE
jgi:hypothetical protein